MRNLKGKKFTWFVVFACMSALLVFAGCNKSEEADCQAPNHDLYRGGWQAAAKDPDS